MEHFEDLPLLIFVTCLLLQLNQHVSDAAIKSPQKTLFFFLFLKESKHIICVVEVKERNEVYWEAREIHLIYPKSFGSKKHFPRPSFIPMQ